MSYIVRNSDGILLMTLENQYALKVINDTAGHFRDYRTSTNPNAKTVYELDEDTTYNTPFGSLYLWEGTLLIPE